MSQVPKDVLYCGVCTLPLEYCIFTARPEKCKKWLEESHPSIYATIYGSPVSEEISDKLDKLELAEESKEGEEGDKKHQSRGGKAILRDEDKKAAKEEEKRKKAKVQIKLVDRNKRKSVTHIKGVEAFGIDLKKVAKRCASKYACGCSVVQNPAGYEEIIIQGDFVYDVLEFLPEEYPEISAKQIEVIDKK